MAAWRLRSLKCWDDQATNCMQKAEGTHRRLEMSASLAVYQLLSCWVCRTGQGPMSVGAHRQVAGSDSSECVGHTAVMEVSSPVGGSAFGSLCVHGTKAHTGGELLQAS